MKKVNSTSSLDDPDLYFYFQCQLFSSHDISAFLRNPDLKSLLFFFNFVMPLTYSNLQPREMSTAMNVTAEKRNAPAKIFNIPATRIILKISDDIKYKIYSSLYFLAKFRSFRIFFF